MTSVLVIEDEAVVASLWVRIFSEFGLSTVAVGSLREGMDALASGGFEFVILDLRLRDSPDLHETIKAIPKMHQLSPHTPIIVATGYSTPDIERAAVTVGALGVADKSLMCDREGIWNIIRGFLEKYAGTGKEGALKIIEFLERLSGKQPDISTMKSANPSNQNRLAH